MELPASENLSSNSSPLTPKRPHSKPLAPVDHLINRVGIGIVDTVQRYYERYLAKPSETNARAYCLWRLRLHRRLKNDQALLEAIDEARALGLFDEKPGKTCWSLHFE